MSSKRKAIPRNVLVIGAVLGAAIAVLVVVLIVNQGHPPSPAAVAPAQSSSTPDSGSPSASTASTSTAETLPAGDVPDNAIFVSYSSSSGGYSLQYVEGWVVMEQANGGVSISDKDSSENVELVALPSGSMSTYVQQTDVPQLLSTVESFKQNDLKQVTVNGASVLKLTFAGLSTPDPVTGKKRQVVNERYYLPGSSKLAILTLTTPAGVDNVDAFNQILQSFSWR